MIAIYFAAMNIYNLKKIRILSPQIYIRDIKLYPL